MRKCTPKGLGLALASSILLGASAAKADELYAVRETDNVLVRIDLPTLTVTDVGPLGIAFDFGGLAWNDDTQTLYAIDGRGDQGLYTVDITTGAATLVGNHGIPDLFGLEYDTSTNTLYATQFAGGSGLYSLDLATGAATVINPSMSQQIGGLAYDLFNDRLIGVEDGAGDLYEIDRATGSQTLLFDGDFTNDSGLAFDPARNLLWDIDWSGFLYSYDVANGFARTTELSGLVSHDGLAYVGVIPEPASATLALLALPLALRRRR